MAKYLRIVFLLFFSFDIFPFSCFEEIASFPTGYVESVETYGDKMVLVFEKSIVFAEFFNGNSVKSLKKIDGFQNIFLLSIKSNKMYLLDDKKFIIYEILNDLNLQKLGELEFNFYPDFYVLNENYAFIFYFDDQENIYKIAVIDISNPQNMQILSYYNCGVYNFNGLPKIKENYLFYADNLMLHILNFSDPLNIFEESYYEESYINAIEFYENFLYTQLQINLE